MGMLLLADAAGHTSAPIQVDFPDRDVAIFRSAMPFLEDLGDQAERLRHLASQSAVVGPDQSEYFDEKHRSSRRIVLADGIPAELLEFVPRIQAAEGALVAAYLNMANPHAVVSRSSGYEILRYEAGQRFGIHVDAVRDHPVLSGRRLAAIGVCSGQFEGGELCFPRQELVLDDLGPGDFLIFPANFTHPHEVRPVRGDRPRWSLITWYF